LLRRAAGSRIGQQHEDSRINKKSVWSQLDANCEYDEYEQSLRIELGSLWEEADDLWHRSQVADGFHAYVSADYDAVFRSLVPLRGRVDTFLEWGSGLGVVTIMASRLGFEAYGIENEPELVEYSNAFGKRYGPDAQFVCGNFFPREFEWNAAEGEIEVRTTLQGVSAYERMGRKLTDFDLVYAYPWPEEHQLYQNVMRKHGRLDSLLLTYDVRRGMELHRCGHPSDR
jgi:hypothetical protein